jgi:D-alanyl-D-alanine carboxypeptidase (penicillin-binding protein 5/6)
MKTGKTNVGGFGIVISAEKNGKRLIAVVNGCKSSKARAAEANKLLVLGFNEFIPVKISDANVPIGVANVFGGKRDKVNLYTKESINISIPKKYKQSLRVELNIKDRIEAPISPGTKLGTLVYKYGSFVSKEYDLYARDQIEKLNLYQRAVLFMKQLIYGKSEESGPAIYKPVIAK